MIIRVRLLPKVLPAFHHRWVWVRSFEIPHRLYDCEVIGLRWPKVDLLNDKEEEASADARQGGRRKNSLGSGKLNIGRGKGQLEDSESFCS